MEYGGDSRKKQWVNGLLKTLKLSKQVLIHGLIITVALAVTQLLLDVFQNSFLLYMPPIGFALFLFISYGIQPIILGALNVVVINRLYNCEGWQVGFWLNGLFILLAFSTINLLLQTIFGLAFSIYVAAVEVFLLSYPFGYLGKFSNRGCKRVDTQQKT